MVFVDYIIIYKLTDRNTLQKHGALRLFRCHCLNSFHLPLLLNMLISLCLILILPSKLHLFLITSTTSLIFVSHLLYPVSVVQSLFESYPATTPGAAACYPPSHCQHLLLLPPHAAPSPPSVQHPVASVRRHLGPTRLPLLRIRAAMLQVGFMPPLNMVQTSGLSIMYIFHYLVAMATL